MKIYLISLPGSFERREILKKRFPKYYDHFTVIDAVDGRKLTAEEYFRLVACSFLKDFLLMTPGEVGCALSHVKAYENLIHSGEEYALILEDDVIGNDKDIEKIQELMPELLNRYGNRFVWYVGGMEGLSKKYIYVKKTSIAGIYVVHELSKRYLYGTFSYVVTKVAAEQILESQMKCLRIADSWDKILPREFIILYSGILKHPHEREGSNIHLERIQARTAPRKVLLNISKEGLLRRLKRFFLIFSPLVGYEKLKE